MRRKEYIDPWERRRKDRRQNDIANFLIAAAVVGLIIFGVFACIYHIIVTGG